MLIFASSAMSLPSLVNQRIHLEQACVLVEVELVERHRDLLELGDLRTLEPERESHAATLVRLQARSRMDVDRGDLLRRVLGHFLDVHAACRGADHGDAPLLAI